MKLVIGTRGSKLALWQAEWIKSELMSIHSGLEVEVKKIKTTGDKILDVPLAKVGGKGLFVKEIEETILRGEADIAVHSMKDVPAELPDGLHLSVICKREDPRDAFIVRSQSKRPLAETRIGKSVGATLESSRTDLRGDPYREVKSQSFKDLPEGAVIGTSSLRRSCQILSTRPDLKIEQLRGNVDTRLKKLDEGQFNAIILAAAGVKRLGYAERITELIPQDISLPAIGQGAIGLECRRDDNLINGLIAPLNHEETALCVKAERAFLKRLEGGCQVPIAAYARIRRQSKRPLAETRIGRSNDRRQKSGDRKDKSTIFNIQSSILVMDGLVGSITGDRIIRGHIEGDTNNVEFLGIKLAEDMLSRGGKEILNEIYG